MKKPIFTGAGVAIITPFTSTGEVNYEEFKKIIDHQIAHGTDAIIIVGTTGESSTMTLKEHAEVVDFGCSYINGRVPVIAGAGSNDTVAAVELTREAAKSGASGVLSVTPYYNKTTQRGLIAHFNAIADASDCPVILYNVPSRTGVSFTAETYKVLSENPKINGVKEASGNFSLLAHTRHLCPDDFYIWSGNDDQVVPMMSLGAKGVISVASNIIPGVMREMTHLCLDNDFQAASKLQIEYMDLIDALFCDVNPIPVKEALNLMGMEAGPVRLPLCELSEKNHERLRTAMAAKGLL